MIGWYGRCPYGVPGDRLWVRETLGLHNCYGLPLGPSSHSTLGGQRVWSYVADNTEPTTLTRKWPAIHMPRWASRITLEITDVRVERLVEVSEEDAGAEGIRDWHSDSSVSYGINAEECGFGTAGSWRFQPTRREAFRTLWDSINGKRPGCAWSDNPWVWAVSYQRVMPA
jgi:hypothetical protein